MHPGGIFKINGRDCVDMKKKHVRLITLLLHLSSYYIIQEEMILLVTIAAIR